MQRLSLQPQDIDALAPSERFLLWALRAWVQCCKAHALPSVQVEGAFADLGLPEAAAALDTALRSVAQATKRPLMVHCPCCAGLSSDERLLVAATAAAQNQDFAGAHRLLSDLVPSVCADRVLGPLRSFGLLLALAGIDLPVQDDFDMPPDPASPAPALFTPTLH